MIEPANRDRHPLVLKAPDDRSEPLSKNPRVLVVDDDSRLVEMMANWLQIDDYNVTKTTDPAEATSLAKECLFDLAIVDITFPSLSGWDLIARLKELQPHLKVIVWTGWDQNTLAPSPFRALVDGVLPKPSRLADLRKMLGECLPRA